uniref:Uncharacterized protein n=1 Tax=Rhizophora mucronata TaxID=61149 RepID=A0A2P2PYR5_RHIMU
MLDRCHSLLPLSLGLGTRIVNSLTKGIC